MALRTVPHAFRPGGRVGTQCIVPGCWGWVDDPRHVGWTRLAPVVDLVPWQGTPNTPVGRRMRAPLRPVSERIKAGGKRR